MCLRNTHSTPVNGFTYVADDAVAEPIISGRRDAQPAATATLLILEAIAGAERT